MEVCCLSLDRSSTVGEVYPASLGTLTEFASDFVPQSPNASDLGLISRFRLQSLARYTLGPSHRVSTCLRLLRPDSAGVVCLSAPELRKSRLRGLCVCGLLWVCSVCAATIAEFRRRELLRMIARANDLGLRVYHETVTFRHSRYDRLASSLEALKRAERAFSAGYSGMEYFRREFGYVGHVSALEVTYGMANGWHPHGHKLVLLPAEVDGRAYAAVARSRWLKILRRQGLDGNEHAYRFDVTNGGAADYVAKWGHEPSSDYAPWGPESEMTRGHLKRGRLTGHLTPFQLLDASECSEHAAALFREFEVAFKGRRQLRWSPGLRYLLLLGDEVSDQALAEGDAELIRWQVLGLLTHDDWRIVRATDAVAELHVALRDGMASFEAFCARLGLSPLFG